MISKKVKAVFVFFAFLSVLCNLVYGQGDKVCVQDVFSISDIEHVQDNRIAILDNEGAKLILYDTKEDKEIWRTGKQGEGPGEFVSPVDIAVNEDGSLVSIRDRNKRVSVFESKTGKFKKSITLPKTLVPNYEGFSYLSDNKYIIGGLKSSKYGKMVQVYEIDSSGYSSSFLDRTKKARRLGISSINDISIALDGSKIYSLHQSDYVISESTPSGQVLRRHTPKYPKYFNEISTSPPDKMDKIKSWIEGASMTKGIHVLNDSKLLSFVSPFGSSGGHIDVISRKSFEITESIPIQGQLLDVNDGKLYILNKLSEKPNSCIRKVSYKNIFSD